MNHLVGDEPSSRVRLHPEISAPTERREEVATDRTLVHRELLGEPADQHTTVDPPAVNHSSHCPVRLRQLWIVGKLDLEIVVRWKVRPKRLPNEFRDRPRLFLDFSLQGRAWRMLVIWMSLNERTTMTQQDLRTSTIRA